MRILLDTNVVLNHLLSRPPWNSDADRIWQAVDHGQLDAIIAATTLTNIAYIARRMIGTPAARVAVQVCLDAFDIAAVDGDLLCQAVAMAGKDLEDDVQILCAVSGNADAIVTRDTSGFRASSIPVLSPVELLQRL
jgi:predicted nucleic acid-binding protein